MASTEPATYDDLTFDVRVAGPRDGTPVVLLHGFPETSRSWTPVARLLVERGFRVIAPDQRGYSPGARPTGVEHYGVPALAGDVLGLLDEFGLDRVHLVGHDWGAAVAWYFAAHNPDRVSALTAVSVPHLAAYGWALREDADQRERSSYIGLFRQEGKAEELLLADDARRLRAMFTSAVDHDSVDHYVAAMSAPGALTAALNWYRAMTRDLDSTPPVRVPTTYIWSTADMAIGRAGAERCGEFVDAEYDFVVLPDVSHWIPEEAPDEIANAVTRRRNG
ncbi:alpha/beta hydrolase [Rhodococcus rhodochrous]|uniref:alpha/beta fold hydrolase n=1 Tax=Rhodococcus TaxID=1827 RepID=UPI000750C88A|nr:MULTISPECIES: alpha/beta hydrolase [Rhodococcus]MDC3724907.1 alpha/beta hydrolase [Rhodococcus sp. Rp3]MDO1486131.1 alpha/beta hydrolase [Rhodococcus rhodochrous]WSE24360.1 alpha/beta hydrolase [Rhodococcus sp. PD04]SNV17062.1 alpha/beta hydrolase [Rhodococcus rhodochrous]